MLHISKCKCQIAVACQHVIAASVEEGSCTAAVGCVYGSRCSDLARSESGTGVS
jgi:hypothetical protein